MIRWKSYSRWIPWVYSNRWHTGTSQERVQALLKMQGNTDRRARFTVVVYDLKLRRTIFRALH
jgi:inosine/xanthosine triphosphate pyrophosphatase family protein